VVLDNTCKENKNNTIVLGLAQLLLLLPDNMSITLVFGLEAHAHNELDACYSVVETALCRSLVAGSLFEILDFLAPSTAQLAGPYNADNVQHWPTIVTTSDVANFDKVLSDGPFKSETTARKAALSGIASTHIVHLRRQDRDVHAYFGNYICLARRLCSSPSEVWHELVDRADLDALRRIDPSVTVSSLAGVLSGRTASPYRWQLLAALCSCNPTPLASLPRDGGALNFSVHLQLISSYIFSLSVFLCLSVLM